MCLYTIVYDVIMRVWKDGNIIKVTLHDANDLFEELKKLGLEPIKHRDQTWITALVRLSVHIDEGRKDEPKPPTKYGYGFGKR